MAFAWGYNQHTGQMAVPATAAGQTYSGPGFVVHGIPLLLFLINLLPLSNIMLTCIKVGENPQALPSCANVMDH